MIKKKDHRYAGDLSSMWEYGGTWHYSCIGHIELSFDHFPSDCEFIKKGIVNNMIVPEKTKYELVFSTITKDYSAVEYTINGTSRIITVSNIRRIQ